MLANQDDLRTIIDRLAIDFTLPLIDDDEGAIDVEDEEDVDYDALYAFFTSLPYLTALSVTNSPWIASLVLSREFCEDALEGLISLEFKNCFEVLLEGPPEIDTNTMAGDRDAERKVEGEMRKTLREWFYYIELYPALLKLNITIDSLPPASPLESSDSNGTEPGGVDEYDVIDTLHIISLIAPLSHPQITSFISCFNQLHLLSLTDTTPLSSSHSVLPILKSIHPLVKNLYITSSAPAADALTDEEFARFTNLDTLGLIGSFWSERVLEALVERSEGIVELVLGRSSASQVSTTKGSEAVEELGITEKALSDLISNHKEGKKLRSLRHLTLDAWLPPSFTFPLSASSSLESLYTTTMASSGGKGLNTKAIERISNLADKNGILLDGTLVDQAAERAIVLLHPGLANAGPIVTGLEQLLSSLNVVV